MLTPTSGEAISGEVTSGSEEVAGGPPENELAPSNRSLFGAQEGIKCQALIYFQTKRLLNASKINFSLLV